MKIKSIVLVALVISILALAIGCENKGYKKEYRNIRREEQTNYTDRETEQNRNNNVVLKLITAPEEYSPAMSSMPGIAILSNFTGKVDKIVYSVDSGNFLTWDLETEIVSEPSKKIELTKNKLVYWSPLEKGSDKIANQAEVTVTLLEGSKTIEERQIHIQNGDGTKMYTVVPMDNVVISKSISSQRISQLSGEIAKPRTINEAVAYAIKEQGNSYRSGEVITEGYIILDTKEKDDRVIVYTIASVGIFGFENGIFTKVAGSGAIPTVITLVKDENSNYSIAEYKEPMDGAGHAESIKDMFPQDLWDSVFKDTQNTYTELEKQQEKQAKSYLKMIGRNAEVSAEHVKKDLIDIDVKASNKIFAEYTKYDVELNNFPFWIGTKELIQNGNRYIYETSQRKSEDGNDLVIFIKKGENDEVVFERIYKIIGSEVELIEN